MVGMLMRDIPEPSKAIRQSVARQPDWSLELELATPMIGGGAVSGHPDVHWPIRGTAIRGHLRFWWRATHGCLLSVEAMREREAFIFGSAGNVEEGGPGLVDVSVEWDSMTLRRISLSSAKYLTDGVKDGSIPSYVGSLLVQGEVDKVGRPKVDDRVRKKYLPEGAKWKLLVSIDAIGLSAKELAEIRHEIGCAIGAWISFGGVGARTRRGCGSLRLIDGVRWDGKYDLDFDLKGRLSRNADNPNTPFLYGGLCFQDARTFGSMKEAWFAAVNFYQLLRKGITVADFREATRQGRFELEIPGNSRNYWSTNWPEDHELDQSGGLPSEAEVPRAWFGLPLHIQPESKGIEIGIFDTDRNSLTRFPSPVICKGVKIDGQYRAMLVVLSVPRFSEDELAVSYYGHVEDRIKLYPTIAPSTRRIVSEPAADYVAKHETIIEYLRAYVKSIPANSNMKWEVAVPQWPS